MNEPITNEIREREFKKFMGPRLFGLVASVDDRRELFPMASAVIIEVEGWLVLLTAAHYLTDVMKWHKEGRMDRLSLLVNHESGICSLLPLDLSQNLLFPNEIIDVGFILLDEGIVGKIIKHGGKPQRTDNATNPPANLTSFVLVGLASRYCQLVSETIASSEREASEWKMHKLTGFALAFAHLKIDGEGAGVGTYRFLPQAQIGDGSVPEM